MRVSRSVSVVIGVVSAIAASACVGKYKSDFPVVIENRTQNALQVLANGDALGQVSAGQSGSFTLSLQESNTNTFTFPTNGPSPTTSKAVLLATAGFGSIPG